MKPAIHRRLSLLLGLLLSLPLLTASADSAPTVTPERQQVLEAMKRATTFMVDKVAYKGGYVWQYLPDMSRRWGEMEARDTMIWLQPPGTSSMGHVFLDAYHATGDEYYYRAAEQVASAIIWGQHPSGGWNYVVDFAGDRSLRDWYATVGRNAWRLEEFQHYYGNATFDDEVTSDAAKFLLRLYVEKHDPRYKPALDKAIQFVLDSQYPIGAWPQRFPLNQEFSKHGRADYSSYFTFNDDVAAQNVYFLIFCYEVLGEQRLLDPITRGMNFFLLAQQGPPQPGWGLQYTPDVRPAGARSYEPLALATHTTAANIGHMITFYEMTGDSKFIARVPDALDWLQSKRLPDNSKTASDQRTLVPTFIELGTDKPLYVHRRGSNAINGEYYVDYDPKRTPSHYSATRRVDIAGLRKRYEAALAKSAKEWTKDSPLFPGAGATELPRFFATQYEPLPTGDIQALTTSSVGSLNPTGYWPAPLKMTSHPYRADGSKQAAKGDFASTHVGDETDTSPFPDPNPTTGISTAEYMKHMNVLIHWLAEQRMQ